MSRSATALNTESDLVLVAERINKRFGSQWALHDVSLTLGRNDILSVMGPSGSGKTTLLLTLSGVLMPDSGQVIYGDETISQASESRRSELRRQEFGLVFQFGNLIPELTCVENVAVPLWLTNGYSRSGAVAKSQHVLERLGMDALLDRFPGTLSGGESQRVAVARALVTHPTIIFADEPTGSLDSDSSERVMSLLREAVDEFNIAMVIVTHHEAVAAYGTRRVQMHDGRLEADD